MSDISCVSNKVHTTRQNILAAYTEGDTQLEFYDSPGTVTREHLLKHRLEESLITEPKAAVERCDLIAVLVDASNPRERRKINKGVLRMLQDHEDRESILIMNKIDLIKEKRQLLDIGTRLTGGYIENKLVLEDPVLLDLLRRKPLQSQKPTSKYVIELDKDRPDDESSLQDQSGGADFYEGVYRNFSRVFSISAKEDDGIDNLREALLGMAKPVAQWPHGPEFLSPCNSKDLVNSIIRGKVMDYAEKQVPYLVKYNYRQYMFDEMNSLFIDLQLKVPKKYMVGKLLGQNGVTIFRITNESREKISTTLGCDVKLRIEVTSTEK